LARKSQLALAGFGQKQVAGTPVPPRSTIDIQRVSNARGESS
jgi:hypothetical protein